MSLPVEIKTFLAEQSESRLPRSVEFKTGPIVVYLRSGEYINAENEMRMRAAAISRIDVKPEFQNKGRFKEFLTALEEYAVYLNYHYVRVEQVHNKILRDALSRYGYYPFQDVYVKRLVGSTLSTRQRFEQAMIRHGYTVYELASQHTGGVDTDEVIAARWFGYQEALTDHVGIQEAWEAAGGNPGIKASREELLSTLRMMNEADEERDDCK
jgi:GNAT superfamily N-acetyltransferase